MKTCVFGALNLLELATRTGARIFQASTSEIYGDPLIHPQVENYGECQFRLALDHATMRASAALKRSSLIFTRSTTSKFKIARIFNHLWAAYAPDDAGSSQTFIVQALEGTGYHHFNGDGSADADRFGFS